MRLNSWVGLGAAIVALVMAVQPVEARKPSSRMSQSELEMQGAGRAIELPAAGTLEVAFSPDEGSLELVIKVINSTRQELRVLGYSFTSAQVVDAILRAKKRGVNIQVVVDQKNNTSEDRSGKARAALGALVNAGIDVRTVSAYGAHHDKVIVSDRETVELGSFNFSDAAARRNSENVLVNWRNPRLAEIYLAHFARNYAKSYAYSVNY